jgi:hypothetical protein
VQSLSIVDVVDEAGDGASGVGEIAILGGIDLFGLEGFHEALGHGVVVRTSRPAHAGLDAGLLQTIDVVAAGVLNPSVGVMDELAAPHVASGQRHLERRDRQAGLQVIFQCPTDHLAAEGIRITAR